MIALNIHKMLKAEGGTMDLHINTAIHPGELVALYGPSGAGKTSTLRMLAGLLDPDSGTISNDDTPWFDATRKINLNPGKRKIGYVFQDYALFPNMTVRQNLQFAQKKRGNTQLISTLLDMVEVP